LTLQTNATAACPPPAHHSDASIPASVASDTMDDESVKKVYQRARFAHPVVKRLCTEHNFSS
jgi:hypothetical protein